MYTNHVEDTNEQYEDLGNDKRGNRDFSSEKLGIQKL